MTMKTKKTLQHIAAVAVVLLTLCLVFTAPVSAEDEVVISIGTADELIELAQNITNGEDNYKGIQFSTVTKINLTNNINLKGKIWTPIGLWTENQFATNGFNFDGDGKEIQNLYYEGSGTHVSGEAKYYLGFISNSSCNVNIKDVTFINPTIIGTPTENMGGVNGVGTVIGCVHSGTVTLDNVDVVGGTVTGFGKVGGLIGFTQNAPGTSITINNCDVSLELTLTGGYNIGGLVGFIQNNPTITVSSNSVDCEFIFSQKEYSSTIYKGQRYMLGETGEYYFHGVTKGYIKSQDGTHPVIGSFVSDSETKNIMLAFNTTAYDENGDAIADSAVYDIIDGVSYTNVITFTDGKLTSLASGNYTLQDDIKIGSTIEITGEVCIDMNGYDIDGSYLKSGYLFKVVGDALLEIVNIQTEPSTITSGGSGVSVQPGAGLFIYSEPAVEEGETETAAAEDVEPLIILDVVYAGIAAHGYDSELTDENKMPTTIFIDEYTEIQTDGYGINIFGSTSSGNNCFDLQALINGDITGTQGGGDGTVGIFVSGNIKTGNSNIILGPEADIVTKRGTSEVVSKADAQAISSNGYITTIILGASLEGSEAIGMKAGELFILDGNFKGTGTYADPAQTYNDGTEMTGAAISVTNTYVTGSGPSGVEITIMGGTFESDNGHAVFAGKSGDKQNEADVLTSFAVAGLDAFWDELDDNTKRTFESLGFTKDEFALSFTSGGNKDAIKLNGWREGGVIGIASGVFSTDVDAAYLAPNYHTKQVEKGYIVTNLRTVTINGGAVTDIENGTKFTKPADPTKSGHTFGGWFTDADFKTAYNFDAPVTADITLYAKWTENKQTTTGGGGGSSSSSSSSSSKPTTPVEPETPVEEPVAGEVTVETEVTDGGEVELEAPVEEPEAGEVGTPAAEDEAKITGVVLPTGTEGKVEFVPISEQAAPEGKETQTKKVFEINVPNYEKGKPATIKFQMTVAELEADGKTAAQVALWHFDEETGEWTKLVTSYVIVDGVVYFEAITNGFSPFAIIYEDAPAEEPTEEPVETPAPLLAVLAALGVAVVLRRK